MGTANIASIVETQRAYFDSGATRSLEFRKSQLNILISLVQRHEKEIFSALKSDLNKPEFEAYATEAAIVLAEAKLANKKLSCWAKPKRVGTPFALQPAKSEIHCEPYGVSLIIAPWNYPFQLLAAPMVGAMAAGNCIVAKPSELAPACSSLVAKLIKDNFDSRYIACVEGGPEETTALLEQHFDYIMFTGGTKIGKIVMAAAAKHLTPVTLELGGKSPCFVGRDTPIEQAARRIAWGKCLNAGQTCVAPDYVLVDDEQTRPFIEAYGKAVKQFYGDDPAASPDYCRIINDRHFQRLLTLLPGGKIASGGKYNSSTRYIEPTLLSEVDLNSAVMQEEIFGPLLPVIPYKNLDEAMAIVRARPTPLALYIFSDDRGYQQRILGSLNSGGACINDLIIHTASHNLPFGGIGTSGMGAVHGKASFLSFSHQKSVLKRSFNKAMNLAEPVRYAPYREKIKLLRWLM